MKFPFAMALGVLAMIGASSAAQAAHCDPHGAPCARHYGADHAHHRHMHGHHMHRHHMNHMRYHHRMLREKYIVHGDNLYVTHGPTVPRYVVQQGPTYEGPEITHVTSFYNPGGLDTRYPYIGEGRGYVGGPYANPLSYHRHGYRHDRRHGTGPVVIDRGGRHLHAQDGVIRADAEVRIVGKDRIEIRLKRKGAGHFRRHKHRD